MRRRSSLWLAFVLVLSGACAAGKGDYAPATKDAGSSAKPDSAVGPGEDGAAPLEDGAGPPLDDTGAPPDDSTVPDTEVPDAGAPVDAGADTAVDAALDTKPPITKALQIEPADTIVTLVGGSPAKRAFAAKLIGSDGSVSDVTAATAFSLADATLGSFAGSTLTAVKAGKSTVNAASGGYGVATSITISAPAVVIGPGATTDAPTKFGGAVDAAASPSFVYPQTGTLVPPNMNVFEFHFLPGAGNTLFELSFGSATVDTKVYFGCTAVGSGCVYTPDATVWKLVAEGGRGVDPVSYKLRGFNPSTGKVGVSAAQTISFGQENILGGIYYWNAAAGATMRYEFGVSGKTGETYMNAATAGATTCVGCHVLSRAGHRIAVGLDIPAPSPYKVFDVASKTVVYALGSAFGGGANFFSFSPDETKVLSSNGVNLGFRNAVTGAAIVDPLVSGAAMPDWSPDGARAVYAKPQTPPPCIGFCGATGVDKASIMTMPFDGAKWGASTTLVPYSGQNNFYPAYSPDGQWVVFNRSPSDANSYDAKDAQVWVVPAAGGAPIKLGTASTGGDSWPKWTAAVQAYKSGSLVWVTFSSRRAYGLRSAAGATAQIWMTAFDPARAKAGADASYPAFWLPFQDLGSGNHIAQWVTKVDRKPCKDSSECPYQQCIDGFCRPPK